MVTGLKTCGVEAGSDKYPENEEAGSSRGYRPQNRHGRLPKSRRPTDHHPGWQFGNIRPKMRPESGKGQFDRVLKRATSAGKNGPPLHGSIISPQTPSLCDQGLCGEIMLPIGSGGGPRESAKVARFKTLLTHGLAEGDE